MIPDMGSSVRLSVVRYFSVAAVVVGFWLLAAAPWGPGKGPVVDVMSSRDETPRRDPGHGRALKAVEDDLVHSSPLELMMRVSEEELGVLQASLPKMHHSPEVFALSYDEMRRRMQVWVYPEQEGSGKYEHKRFDDGEEKGGEKLTEELSSTADLFFRLLMRSEFVTESPSNAHLFLMPVSLDALWVDLGGSHVADQLRRYVQKIRTAYPFWDSSLGADHLYLSCHAFEHNTKHRNILEFGKNAIQAACSPLRHGQRFYPHKDLVFPEHNPITEHEIRTALTTTPNRTTLAYFVTTNSLPQVSDPDLDVETDPSLDPSTLYSKLARSKFCVSVPPHDSLSVIDALRFGCVPVLASQTVFHDLPFQGFLNWREFAVVLGVEQLPNLKLILESISPAKY